MKRSLGSHNTQSSLSDSVHHQLNMYVLAAGAAGVGVLALSQPTEAEIIYTPAHITIGVGQNYKLDLNHDGITDFTLMDTKRSGDSTAFYSLFERPAGGNAVVARYDHNHLFRLAKALWRGARIQAGRPFYDGYALMASVLYGPGGTASYGSWVNVRGRYLGLRFKINGQTHYGWARLSVSLGGQGRGVIAILTGYAYESIPDKAIIAGNTKGPADALGETDFGSGASLTSPIPDKPQPTLGVLAMGAHGLSVWRRESAGPAP